jgi:serine/threonine protein kinase
MLAKGSILWGDIRCLHNIKTTRKSVVRSLNEITICSDHSGKSIYICKETQDTAHGLNEVGVFISLLGIRIQEMIGQLVLAWHDKCIYTLWIYESGMVDLFQYVNVMGHAIDTIGDTLFVIESLVEILLLSKKVHYDISPENILVNSSPPLNCFRLIDWACAMRYGELGGGKRGKKEYASPEVMQSSIITADPRHDVYSIGVVSLVVISRRTSDHIPYELKKAIEECLNLDKNKRPSLLELGARCTKISEKYKVKKSKYIS